MIDSSTPLLSLGPLTSVYQWIEQYCKHLDYSVLSSDSSALAMVFDCDQTLIKGDIGEILFIETLRRGWIKSSDEWWSLFDSSFQDEIQTHLRPLYEHESDLADSFQSSYLSLTQLEEGTLFIDHCFEIQKTVLTRIWELYEETCTLQIQNGYRLAAQCLSSWSLEHIQRWCTLVVDHARACPQDQTFTSLPFSTSITLRKEIFHLIQKAQFLKISPWIMSSSFQGVIDVIGAYFKIPAHQCVGIGFQVSNDQETDISKLYLTSNPLLPTPIQEGKVERFLKESCNQPPLLMFGDSRYDLPLMHLSQKGVLICYPHLQFPLSELPTELFMCQASDFTAL